MNTNFRRPRLKDYLIASSLFLNYSVYSADCSQLSDWNADTPYTTGQQTQFKNVAYQANWWTRNHQPDRFSNPFQEWTSLGTCDSGNMNPTVTLTSPLANTSFSKNDSVIISASAADTDGSITQVEFQLNGTSLGIQTAPPYTQTWQATTGGHLINAIATDNGGATAQSSVSIQVVDPNNQPPNISLTSPTPSKDITAGQTLVLAATASDSDGAVTQVDFYLDNIQLATDTQSPYEHQWLANAGQHNVKARAMDNTGAVTFSPDIEFTVKVPNSGGCNGLASYSPGSTYSKDQFVQHQNRKFRCDVPGWCSSSAAWAYAPVTGQHWADAWTDSGLCSIGPVVSITSPSNNAVLLNNRSVTFTATANDQDGSINQVEFFANNVSLGEDFTPPYSVSWLPGTDGETQLKALATDNDGNKGEASHLVTVSSAPVVVSLTTPSSGTTLTLGKSLNLTAQADSLVSEVSKVEFLVNGAVVATDTAAPYESSWTPGSTGTYTLQIRATDTLENTADSSAVTVTVIQAPSGKTHKLIGYWHNFENPAGCPVKLSEISNRWDIIDIAFADNDINSNGTVHFNLFNGTGSSCPAIDPVQFKQDIATLRSQGKIIVLSLGGAEGTITLNTDSDESNFVSSLTSIIQQWGFDGLDIDLESGSNLVHGSQIQARLPRALKQIEQNTGGNMYLTMAPEHPYVQGGFVAYTGIWGAYIPLIDNLRDTLDLLHVQLYNNGGLSHPYGPQSAPAGSVDMMVASARMLTEGFTLANGSQFTPLRDDQVALGLPSGPASAGSGQATTQNIANALDCLVKGNLCQTITPSKLNPQFAGVMTWSINWDIHDNFNFSGPVGDKLAAMNSAQ